MVKQPGARLALRGGSHFAKITREGKLLANVDCKQKAYVRNLMESSISSFLGPFYGMVFMSFTQG